MTLASDTPAFHWQGEQITFHSPRKISITQPRSSWCILSGVSRTPSGRFTAQALAIRFDWLDCPIRVETQSGTGGFPKRSSPATGGIAIPANDPGHDLEASPPAPRV